MSKNCIDDKSQEAEKYSVNFLDLDDPYRASFGGSFIGFECIVIQSNTVHIAFFDGIQ